MIFPVALAQLVDEDDLTPGVPGIPRGATSSTSTARSAGATNPRPDRTGIRHADDGDIGDQPDDG
jgi:hypothetical protein